MTEKKNLLIIGAAGGVAGAFLKRLADDRNRFGSLVLIDAVDRMGSDPALCWDRLGAEFLHRRVDAGADRAGYRALLENRRIDVVIDLSVNETRPMLAETDAAGACYLNTGIANRIGEDFAGVVFDLVEKKTGGWKRPHILCAGMNPGIVNHWVQKGIERHGRPLRITHFEYDSGEAVDPWRPVITWSRETFLDEIANDPAGYMAGRGRMQSFYPNPLKHRVAMDDILAPILSLKVYPRGFLLLHEENVTIAQACDVPSRFVFANDIRTMDHLESCYDNGRLSLDDLHLGDNRGLKIRGSVLVGIRLEYPDRWVYRYNRTGHDALDGSSGSCLQVAAGLHAALLTLVGENADDRLEKGIYFCEDLSGTAFERLAAQNLDSVEVVLPANADVPWDDFAAVDAAGSETKLRVQPADNLPLPAGVGPFAVGK